MTVSYFLITINVNGTFRKIGTVQNGKRLSCDEQVSKFFPATQKFRKELLNACHWCMNGNQVVPNWVDAEIGKNLIRIAPVKA